MSWTVKLSLFGLLVTDPWYCLAFPVSRSITNASVYPLTAHSLVLPRNFGQDASRTP
jgi:hypothetical protein